MKTAETIQENAEDIVAEAKLMNEERAAEEEAAFQEEMDGFSDEDAAESEEI